MEPECPKCGLKLNACHRCGKINPGIHTCDNKLLAAERAERDAWKQLAEGYEGLCTAYRTGSRRTPEKALDKISDARVKLAAILQEWSDGD